MAGPTVFLAPSYRPPQPQRPTLDGALLHTKNVELRARKSGGRVGGMAEEENHERIDAATGDSLALGRLSLAVFLSSLNGDSHLFATKANRYSTAHDPPVDYDRQGNCGEEDVDIGRRPATFCAFRRGGTPSRPLALEYTFSRFTLCLLVSSESSAPVQHALGSSRWPGQSATAKLQACLWRSVQPRPPAPSHQPCRLYLQA